MHGHKSSIRLLVALISSGCVAIFPLAATALLGPGVSAEHLGQPIDFTPNVKQLELTSIAVTAIAQGFVAPAPTLGPGQLYEEQNRPEVSLTEGGNDEFGYGPSKENPDVYVVWMTDENGTHYFTVGSESDELRGTLDKATNTRSANGYVHLIAERQVKLEDISDAQNEANTHQSLRMTSHYGALGLAFLGGVVCGIVTGGACFVAFGVAAGTAWVAGVVQNGEKAAAQDNVSRLEGQLQTIDTRLQGKFGQTMRTEASP